MSAILLLAGTLVALRARALHEGFHHRHGFSHIVATLTWKLDLTEAQQAQVKSMMESEWPNVQPIVEGLAAGQKEMVAATQSGNFDEGKVQAIAGNLKPSPAGSLKPSRN